MKRFGRARMAALAAVLAAAALSGVVWLSPLRNGEPAAPSPWEQLRSELEGPIDPLDPLAILVQCEPSPDGRWLVFGLDLERVAGAQSLYVVSLADGGRLHLAEGVLAPEPWDSEGRLVFIDRSSDAPRATWFDVERFEAERSAPARELAGAEGRALLGPQWALRTQTRRSEGGYLERITWRDRDAHLELTTSSLFDVELGPAPGVVFELRRSKDTRTLLRHDLRAPGRATTLFEAENLALFRVSPDGAKVVTSERAKGVVSCAVRDGKDGRVLAGPWSGEELSVSWLTRADSRYVLLHRRGAAELVDLESGRVTPLGEYSASSLDVRVLDDGRVVRRTERTVDVLDSDGAVALAIFPANS
jgi:hypothetical protein